MQIRIHSGSLHTHTTLHSTLNDLVSNLDTNNKLQTFCTRGLVLELIHRLAVATSKWSTVHREREPGRSGVWDTITFRVWNKKTYFINYYIPEELFYQ